jgi:hypothetical protein
MSGIALRAGLNRTERANLPNRQRRRLYLEVLESRCVPSTVTNLSDHDPGSLRDALAITPPGGTVDFQPGLSGTITLSSASLAIAKDVTLTGPGAAVITISGNSLLPVLNIAPAITVTITGLTIANGKSAVQGGGISNAGELTLTDCVLMANSVQSSGTALGGGLSNEGTATVDRCSIGNNSARGGSSQGATSWGGGIFNTGTLTVLSSTLSGNSVDRPDPLALGDRTGGGIYSSGTLTIADSTLSGNSARAGRAGALGGAIDNSGTMTITTCTLTGNSAGAPDGAAQGGAIMNRGVLTIAVSTLSNNSTSARSGGGGAIYNTGAGTLAITQSTLSGNTAATQGGGGGSIDNFGSATVSKSLITNSFANGESIRGGGIENGGLLTIVNSSILANTTSGTANLGGGISNTSSLAVIGCTLSNNAAGIDSQRPGQGGGIYNSGNLVVRNSTFSGNQVNLGVNDSGGGGVYSQMGLVMLAECTLSGNTAGNGTGGGIAGVAGTIEVFNTIVAGNMASSAADVAGVLSSLGHNLIGIGEGGSGYVDTDLVGTSARPLDPRLGSLQENGGPTQTMALLPGSPAIDAGGLTDSEWDQRGPGYPRLVHDTNDIGAYEVQPGGGSAAVAHRLGPLPGPVPVPESALNPAGATPSVAPDATSHNIPTQQMVASVDRLFAPHGEQAVGFVRLQLRQKARVDAPSEVENLVRVDRRLSYVARLPGDD